jgi:hypothetical protein
LCYICRPFEGQTFRYDWSTSPEYQRFPLLPREAPFHPNCYHRRVPVSYPDDLEAMSADELETLGRDNRGLYAYMRDEMPQGKELMWAARHGFATEAQQRTYRRMAHQVGMPEKDLRGPRWRYAGIESRRPEAIGRMIMDPRLRYKDAMASETQAFMRSPSYKKQRPKSLTPAAQRRAVAAMLREERAAARMAR